MTNSESQEKSSTGKSSKKIGIIILVVLSFMILPIFTKTCSKFAIKGKQQNEQSCNCKNSINYGDIRICLPEISGMNESSKVPKVKEILGLKGSKSCKVLAYYINDETYQKVNELDQSIYDDYLYIYGIKGFENTSVDQSNLESYTNDITNYNWSNILKNVEKKLDSLSINLSIGKFINIESYSLNDRVNSIVMLSKVQSVEKEYVLICIMNVVLIKERVALACYYKFYDGQKSIKAAKAKNDYMVLQFVNENK